MALMYCARDSSVSFWRDTPRFIKSGLVKENMHVERCLITRDQVIVNGLFICISNGKISHFIQNKKLYTCSFIIIIIFYYRHDFLFTELFTLR
jgi:hypothetical protein